MTLQFTLTPRLSQSIQSVLIHHNENVLDKSIELQILEKLSSQSCISLENVKLLSNLLQQINPNSQESYIPYLLQGSGFYFEPIPLPQKSPQLLSILKEAQDKVDQQEYERMTRNIQTKKSHNDLLDTDFKFLVGQISNIFNVLLSMLAVFVAFMYFGYYWIQDVGMRVLSSLGCALIVGIAEGYFLSKDLLKWDLE